MPMLKRKKAEKLPPGEIMTDLSKRQWRLGTSIGVGGCGQIYSASDEVKKEVGSNAKYVIKVEPHENSALFTELHCYVRIGREEKIKEYIKTHKLTSLGISKMIGNGSHEYNGTKYRFLVIEKFGKSIQDLFEESGKKLPPQTILNLGIKMVHVLDYMQSLGYTHGDVKGSNILLDVNDQNKAYLVDFGLATKFMSTDSHKPFKLDKRFAHNGTIEYVSRDMHIGVPTRRSDLEILGYNLVHWCSGYLPWESCLTNDVKVKNMKNKCMKDIGKFVKQCVPSSGPVDCLTEYLTYVDKLEFDELPDYKHLKSILIAGLKKLNLPNDGKLVFKQSLKRIAEGESSEESPRKKRMAAKRGKPEERLENVEAEVDVPEKTEAKVPKRKLKIKAKPDNAKEKVEKKKSPARRAKKVSSKPEQTNLENPTPQMLDIMNMKSSQKNGVKTDSPTEKMSIGNPTPQMLDIMSMKSSQKSDVKTDTPTEKMSIDNPTPQMLDIMKFKNSQKSGVKTDTPTEKMSIDNPTPLMKEVLDLMKSKETAIKKRGRK